MAPPRSKDVSHYIEGQLTDLKPDIPLPFDIHLYFPINRHMMVWRRKDEAPDEEFLKRYLKRGVTKFWVHRDDAPELIRYRNTGAEKLRSEAEERRKKEIPSTTSGPRTEGGAVLAQVLSSPEIPVEEKKAVVAQAARLMIQESAASKSPETQKKADAEIRKAVQDILDSTAMKTHASIVSEIWNLCDVEPELEHAANVATYAVVFAMAFGRIEEDLIADIALAGLLHDIGFSQIPVGAAFIPWKKMDPPAAALYSKHVEAGAALLKELAPQLPARVRELILQHHEKFDGSGYPRKLQGFRVDDVAQLLGLADLLDAIVSGAWDGRQRTLKQAFDTIEKMERSKNFPEYFNPEVFSAVIKWIRTTAPGEKVSRVSKLVGRQAREMAKAA